MIYIIITFQLRNEVFIAIINQKTSQQNCYEVFIIVFF